jgi:7 transmembrane receptor (rhodopsin family)
MLLTAIYSIWFVFEKVWKTDSNQLNQPQAVYNNLSVELSNENNEDEVIDRQMTKTVKAISFFFAVCWLPFFIAISESEETTSYSLKKYTFLLTLIKSAFNPIVCVFMNAEFRQFQNLKCW